jgi:CBS domain containing-hemolysin-like protein
MRVSDIDLWKAPLARAGQASDEVRAELTDAEVPYPLLVDDTGRPVGWLSNRDLESDRVPERPDSPLGPLLEADDIMRDALADLLQGQAQYAAVVDSRGQIDGVLSIEIISDFLGSPAAEHDEHSATERPKT